MQTEDSIEWMLEIESSDTDERFEQSMNNYQDYLARD